LTELPVHGTVAITWISLYMVAVPHARQETVKVTSLLSVTSIISPEEVLIIHVLLTTVGREGVRGLVVSIMRSLFPERLLAPVGSMREALLLLLSRMLDPVGSESALLVT